MQIDCAFPGGNILVDGIDGDVARIHQDLRDTEGDWFYWSFRVRGAHGRTVRFEFTGSNPIGVRGPAVSADGGKSWQWLGTAAVTGQSFAYTFAHDAREVYFALGIPYLESHLHAFLAKHRANSHLIVSELCKTKRGRSVELLRAGRIDGKPAHRVLLTARHHSCEAVVNYTLDGLLDSVLSTGALGDWFREHVEILAVPFMDKDGVEDGDQGKNRKPYDHNRDYGTDLYASVSALRKLVPDWSGGRLRAALDLHCPWIRSGNNETIYFVGTSSAEHWNHVGAFSQILERERTGPLPFQSADNLAFGLGWNTYNGPLMMCQNWAQSLPGVRLAATLEIPYANASGAGVSAESAHAFGRDLAVALQHYLKTIEV